MTHASKATPSAQPTARKLLTALRAFSLPVTLLPIVMAAAAVAPAGRWDWPVLIMCLLGAGGVSMCGNLLNDYFDFRSGADRAMEDDRGRPGRLLVTGLLLPRHVLIEAIACLAVGAICCGYVIARAGWPMAVFVAVGAAGAWAYTAPPVALKRRRLGEPAIFVLYGPLLMVAAAWAQTHRLEPLALVLSAPVGMATTAILVGNNFRDRREDAQAGVRTLGQLADGRLARLLYVALVLASVLGFAAIGLLQVGPWALVIAPLALVTLRGPLKAMVAGQRMADIDARTARFGAILMLLVTIAYLVWAKH